MIGCMAGTNDLYFFLEEGEVEEMKKNLIEGVFINLENPEIKGNLTCMVSNQTTELIDVKLVKERPGVFSLAEVFVCEEPYQELISRGRYWDHQEFGHVNLFDATRDLPFGEGHIYRQLVYYRNVLK